MGGRGGHVLPKPTDSTGRRKGLRYGSSCEHPTSRLSRSLRKPLARLAEPLRPTEASARRPERGSFDLLAGNAPSRLGVRQTLVGLRLDCWPGSRCQGSIFGRDFQRPPLRTGPVLIDFPQKTPGAAPPPRCTQPCRRAHPSKKLATAAPCLRSLHGSKMAGPSLSPGHRITFVLWLAWESKFLDPESPHEKCPTPPSRRLASSSIPRAPMKRRLTAPLYRIIQPSPAVELISTTLGQNAP